MASKSNADTAHLSHDEIKQHNLHESKRPPGKAGGAGGVLHQHGGASVRHTRNYPLVLGAGAIVVGLGTWAYYRSVHPEPKGQAGSHSPKLQKEEESKKAATQT